MLTKNLLSSLSRFLHIGKTPIGCWQEQSTIAQAPPPWWCHLLIERHGNGDSAHLTPGSLCRRGWLRAVCKAKSQNYLLLTAIYFYFYYAIDHYRPQKRWHYIPRTITPSLTFSHILSASGPSIFGWLLRSPSSLGGRLMPSCILFVIIFCRSNHCSKGWDNIPPFALTPSYHLFNLHTIAIINCRLVVVYFH